MTRNEIQTIQAKYDQLQGYESMVEDLKTSSRHKWWAMKWPKPHVSIETPHRECSISTGGSRQRFIDWLDSEIKILKTELGLEDTK